MSLRGGCSQPQVQAGGEQLQRAQRAQRVAAVQTADVVACTLASAGGDLLSLLEGKPMFDALVIDEARLILASVSVSTLQGPP